MEEKIEEKIRVFAKGLYSFDADAFFTFISLLSAFPSSLVSRVFETGSLKQ